MNWQIESSHIGYKPYKRLLEPCKFAWNLPKVPIRDGIWWSWRLRRLRWQQEPCKWVHKHVGPLGPWRMWRTSNSLFPAHMMCLSDGAFASALYYEEFDKVLVIKLIHGMSKLRTTFKIGMAWQKVDTTFQLENEQCLEFLSSFRAKRTLMQAGKT